MEYHHYFIGQFRVFFSVFHQPVFKPYEGFHVMYDIGALVHFFDSGGQLYQIVGYLLSEDPTYITNHNNARSLICKIDRDELMQELVQFYLDN